jgi:hypothetical protein
MDMRAIKGIDGFFGTIAIAERSNKPDRDVYAEPPYMTPESASACRTVPVFTPAFRQIPIPLCKALQKKGVQH